MSSGLGRRVDERIAAWRIVVDRFVETESSVLAFGRRGDQPVVLKVVRNPGEEWRCGEVLEAFGGNGTVRVYEYMDGAVLLEHLEPGTPLVSLVRSGFDDEATDILADVIARMSPVKLPSAVVASQDRSGALVSYLASEDSSIPEPLVIDAHRVYAALCRSQAAPRLLHGDLHHDNVLFDSHRGWVAIDPKGVVAELEFEVGAALRNPYENLSTFANAAAIERRIERFRRRLKIDSERALQWGFAQAVLAAVWAVEDGAAVGPENAWIALAGAIRPMITA